MDTPVNAPADRRYAAMIILHEGIYSRRVQSLPDENVRLIRMHSQALKPGGDFDCTRQYHHRQKHAACSVFVDEEREVQLDCQLRPVLIRARAVRGLTAPRHCWPMQPACAYSMQSGPSSFSQTDA